MEHIFEAIKGFILSDLGEYLLQMESEGCPLPVPSEKDVIFGAVDVSRQSGKVIVAVLPDEQEEAEPELGSDNMKSSVTVSFLISGNRYEVLVRQMARYCAALRRAILDNPSLTGKVEDTAVGKRKFFTNAGTVEKQMTAFEISLTVYTDDEIQL